MLLPTRRLKRAYLRPLLHALVALLALDAWLIVRGRPATALPDPLPPGARRAGNETYFIASIHRNNGPILRAAWSDAMLRLVDYLGGGGSVHVSAVESGSQDDTKDALSDLKAALDARGVPNTFVLGKTVHAQLDEIHDRPPPSVAAAPPGWVWNAGKARFDMRRIPYLARERNLAMEPLRALHAEKGAAFDRVLWFNDVAFDDRDVAALLDTRDGDFAAACAMDFTLWPYYYDTFALRDDRGLKTASWYWPWFHSPRARASAEAMRPVGVRSCWNGLVAFDAAPFYDPDKPLRFRGVDDSLAALHLEGSECCLIHADNPLSRDKGVWLNPNVRVGYNVPVYETVRMGRFPTPWAAVVGVWANRYLRVRNGVQLTLERWVVEKRLRRWVDETPANQLPRTEPGEMCLINEMQIMWMNGWKHI